MRKLGEAEVELDIQVMIRRKGRETGGHQTLAQLLRAGNLQAAPIEVSAPTAFGGVEIIARGIVNHPRNHFAATGEPERDAKHREAMREIRRSVQGINVPAILGGRGVAAAFFSHDAVLGKVALQPLHDQSFGAAVRRRDEVRSTLVSDLHGLRE